MKTNILHFLIENGIRATSMKLWKAAEYRVSIFFEYIYVIFDSNFKISKKDNVLFVDCGSNLGQGYRFFSKFYSDINIKFTLFEPNPNCHPALDAICKSTHNGKVTLNKVGVGTENASVRFYGWNTNDGGPVSQGGSIVESHNSTSNSPKEAITVNIIDFSQYLKSVSNDYDKIVVKMDIEGAELDLLEKLIRDESIRCIDILYVEFHSHCQSKEHVAPAQLREERIIRNIRSNTDVAVRRWH